MTEATDLAAAAGSTDPRVGLRAVVALRLQGLPYQEIGPLTDLSEASVRRILERVATRLRRSLADDGRQP